MAFRHFQRIGRVLQAGRIQIVSQQCTILDFGGPSSRQACSQSVIRLHDRNQLFSTSSLSLKPCALSCLRTGTLQNLNLEQSLSYSPLLKPHDVNPWGSLGVRHFSLRLTSDDGEDKPPKKSIFQRFKDTYKEYGKVLIGVHVATSAVWFGTFYYAAYSGIDIVPLLERLGFGEKVVSALGKPGVGHVAVAYLLYKLATPARYTVTIVGTQMTVKQLRGLGYLQPIKKEDSLRSLFKEGRTQVKERYGDMRDEMTVRMVARREKFTRDFHTQRQRFRTRQQKLKRDLEMRTKQRQKHLHKNGKNGHPRA